MKEIAAMVMSRKGIAGIRSDADGTIVIVFDLTAPTKGMTSNGSMGIVVRGRETFGSDYVVDYTLYRLSEAQQGAKAKAKPVKATPAAEVAGPVRQIVAPATDRLTRLESLVESLIVASAPVVRKPRATK